MFNVVSLVIWNTDLTIMDIYNLTIEGISGERDGPWILSVLRWAGVSLSESPLFIIKTHLASLPPHLSWAELGSRHYFPASYIKLWRYRLADKPLWSGELAMETLRLSQQGSALGLFYQGEVSSPSRRSICVSKQCGLGSVDGGSRTFDPVLSITRDNVMLMGLPAWLRVTPFLRAGVDWGDGLLIFRWNIQQIPTLGDHYAAL